MSESQHDKSKEQKLNVNLEPMAPDGEHEYPLPDGVMNVQIPAESDSVTTTNSLNAPLEPVEPDGH